MAILVAGPAADGALSALPAPVTLDGVGGVRPGLRPAQVASRWGIPVRLEGEGGTRCAHVGAGALRGYAVFQNGRFAAVFFRSGAVTDRGIRIGSRLAAVRRAYGRRLTSEPNKYTPGARDFYVRRSPTPRWELRLDVSPTGHVTQIAFGNRAVRLVEGCA